jgi:hypothetical protein
MVKDITTVAFNSLEVEKRVSNNNNTSFRIETPPIIIKQKGILKVSNFCHIGTSAGHTDNMYLFRIRGIMADTSRFITGNGGDALILTTTFNNNRSLYDENVITLVKQTINSIEILVDTYTTVASVDKNLYFNNPGSGFLLGQLLRLVIASTNYDVIVGDVNAGGSIESIYFLNNDAPTTQYTTIASLPSINLANLVNGTGASITSTSSGAIAITTPPTIIINNPGAGYKVGQKLSFGGAGTGANVVIGSVGPLGQILTLTIISGGTGYSNPTVSISNGTINNGQNANLTAVLTSTVITSITITDGGSGYRAGQTLAFSGGGGSGANISIATVDAVGVILTFSIISGGTGYSSAPTISINPTNEIVLPSFSLNFGQILKEQIPTSLNFSITFIIEQDEF